MSSDEDRDSRREERKKSPKRKKSDDDESDEDDEDRDKRRQRRRAERKRQEDEDSDSGAERRKARRRRKRRERERERDNDDSDGGGRRRRRDRRRSRSRSPDERKSDGKKGRRSRSGSAEPEKERRRDGPPPPPRAPLTAPPPPPPAPERKRVSKFDVPEGAPGAAPPVPPPGMGMNATNTGPSQNPMDAAKQARRLYVGNVPPDTPPAEVVAFLNLTMQDAGLTKYTQPVQAVHQGNSFLFIELPDASEANELLKCDGALFKEHHLKLRKPTNNPGDERRPRAEGSMPNMPPGSMPNMRGTATPGPNAPLSNFALPPDPGYDQASHQLGMARPYQRPTYANVMARFASRITDTGVQDY